MKSAVPHVASPYPIEIDPPDIAPWRTGNSGVDYVHRIDSGRPGPTVMVQALTHGNEYCGAMALDALLRQLDDGTLVPQAGRLILAFANVDAYARFDFADPVRSRCIDEDYNRVWADDVLFGPRDSAELRRARQLQPFVDEADTELLQVLSAGCGSVTLPLIVMTCCEPGAMSPRLPVSGSVGFQPVPAASPMFGVSV